MLWLSDSNPCSRPGAQDQVPKLPLLPELVTLAQRATVTPNFGPTQKTPASKSTIPSGASFQFVPGSPLPPTAHCTGDRPMHVEFALRLR